MGTKKIFLDLDKRLVNKTEVVYPSIHKGTKFKKKKKNCICRKTKPL